MSSSPENKNEGFLESVKTLTDLYSKYSDNPYILQKIQNYVCNQLPSSLESMNETQRQKQLRLESLNNNQDAFIENFLNKNQFFYMPSNEKFFYYDGSHYYTQTEDEILHKVLTTISNDGFSIMSRKYKTKVSIMKKIKENLIIKSVPESETIQQVIYSIYPSFFPTKSEAKYFLTVIGDNMVRKNSHLIHFLPSYAKNFIRELNLFSQKNLVMNVSQTIKFNAHPTHEYSNCRLIHIHETAKYENCWKSVINLDLLCVANHYSLRYDHSDKYIHKIREPEFESYVFYLKDKSVDNLVNSFIKEYIVIDIEQGSPVSWKDMLYLWKRFLSMKKLPTLIYQSQLKNMITENLKEYYNVETDTFINIFSKFLPQINKFLDFWNETMTGDENEFGLELDEIRELYSIWGSGSLQIKSQQVLDIIQYYYPDIITENDKYVQQIRCSLWDKKKDIKDALDDLEGKLSAYDSYVYYCKHHYYLVERGKKKTPIVNKTYFENFYLCL